MKTIQEKIQLIKKHLPKGAIKEVAEQQSVSRTTVWRAMGNYNTNSPILQILISRAFKNAQSKVQAENDLNELAKLSE